MECNSNEFEMFEDMRVYVERNGRSYNYLPSVDKLNKEREEALIKEELNRIADNDAAKTKTVTKEKEERDGLEKLQQKRLVAIRQHMKEVDECK
jgi:adenylate kinase